MLETPRLQLRPLLATDIGPRYMAWMNDGDVNRYLESRFAPHTEATLRRFLDSVDRDSSSRIFAIVLRTTGDHIGNIKIGPLDQQHRRAEVGLIIGEKSCWGQGYGSEAIDCLARWAFADLGVRKLTAGAYASNQGSVRAFLRAGFEIEGVRRAHFLSEGAPEDAVLMARFAVSGVGE